MFASELENYKILLDDARQTYYSRLGHFSNLATKAGVILALIVALITFMLGWVRDDSINITYKLAYTIFLAYGSYLSISVMFIKNVKFMSVDVGMRNLQGYPRMESIEWVKFLIRQYTGFIKEVHEEYDKRNGSLRRSLLFIGLAIIVYLLSLMLK